jgi:hypothetical protein
MRIKLPWKKLGWDGKKHKAQLVIYLETTQQEELMSAMRENQSKQAKEKETNFNKQLSNKSLRKCRGHKKKFPVYDDKGQCSICGGYKY